VSDDSDEYETGVYRWWHLSQPSPELLAAIGDGWIEPHGRVLDLGCGLGVEVAAMVGLGFEATGIDLSEVAIARARAAHPAASFVVGDVRSLPFAAESFDVLLDRGCLHYLSAEDRPRHEAEAWRVLRPGGHLLLRACLASAAARNDLPLDLLDRQFARWSRAAVYRGAIASDTRTMDALVARLEKPR
jgi:SAM-dependent methyltransferase